MSNFDEEYIHILGKFFRDMKVNSSTNSDVIYIEEKDEDETDAIMG